ncbi:MAG: serine O-acetyltransferase, partial [Paracoccaceae bacterium]
MAVANKRRGTLTKVDPVWSRMREEASEIVEKEPLLGSLVHAVVLHHHTLEDALSYRVAQKLSSADMPGLILRDMCDEVLAADASLREAARADIVAVFDRDPACHRYVQPLLFFKGFLAIQSYRIGHHLW